MVAAVASYLRAPSPPPPPAAAARPEPDVRLPALGAVERMLGVPELAAPMLRGLGVAALGALSANGELEPRARHARASRAHAFREGDEGTRE